MIFCSDVRGLIIKIITETLIQLVVNTLQSLITSSHTSFPSLSYWVQKMVIAVGPTGAFLVKENIVHTSLIYFFTEATKYTLKGL